MLSRRERANAIRALSMDAVQQANSGHPGAPMGMADIADVIWNDFLRHNPANPHWINRDRFVLSNGHGSMLLYAALHLSGYALSLDDLKNFRQLHSRTPGHPEYGHTPGVETTTGPLGQGFANAVGMAIAERSLAARFNRREHEIIDHLTYVAVGDGCLMEGISHEAASLAGTLGLGKLIVLYDDNGVSIDGDVTGWFSEDVARRFEACNWHVVRDIDGHVANQVKAAVAAAQFVPDKPSLLCCRTIIGWGAPNKQGKAACHGAPLGEEEVARARKTLGWQHPPFVIPDEYYTVWDARARGAAREAAWQEKFAAYRQAYPALADEFTRRIDKQLPADWQAVAAAHLRQTVASKESMATRKASQKALNAFSPALPELIGGSADLAGSNLTLWSDAKAISAENADGNYLYYGVREFAMAAINSGLALHGGFIPYAATFLIFSDYARNALRMAALMKQRSIFILTHDSIGLGEDGPTHQAVEQAASLRLIPNMSVWRPGDAVETAVAWQAAIERADGPSCLLLSRQSVAHIDRNKTQLAQIRKGAYILIHGADEPDALVIATGSELDLARKVVQQYNGRGGKIRLVSMPSADAFDAQDADYRQAVLPPTCRRRVAIEAGSPDYWRKYVGLDGKVLGVPSFGESAPAGQVFTHFGITADGLGGLLEDILQAKHIEKSA